jgi:hypothetical protein
MVVSFSAKGFASCQERKVEVSVLTAQLHRLCLPAGQSGLCFESLFIVTLSGQRLGLKRMVFTPYPLTPRMRSGFPIVPSDS